MYSVELYARVRQACHIDRMSRREAAQVFGIDHKTVDKILAHSVPPGCRRRRPPLRPKLGPFTSIIDRMPEEDRQVHRKQRHTAKRIHERLGDEHGFTGGYTVVKDYVRECRHGNRIAQGGTEQSGVAQSGWIQDALASLLMSHSGTILAVILSGRA